MKKIYWLSLLLVIGLYLAYRRFGHLLDLKLPPIDVDGITINGLDWKTYTNKKYFPINNGQEQKAHEAVQPYLDQVLVKDEAYFRQLLAESERQNLSYLVFKEALKLAEQSSAVLPKPTL